MPIIRPIREDDAAGFHAALDSVCRERRYLATVEAPAIDKAVEFVRANVEAGHPQFVAEINGVIIGWCDAIPGDEESGTKRTGRLGMGIVREWRGQGIGQRLLKATIAAAHGAGQEKIELIVYATNTPAISLYRKLGFGITGVQKRGRFLDGEYEDNIYMELLLRPAAPRIGRKISV